MQGMTAGSMWRGYNGRQYVQDGGGGFDGGQYVQWRSAEGIGWGYVSV